MIACRSVGVAVEIIPAESGVWDRARISCIYIATSILHVQSWKVKLISLCTMLATRTRMDIHGGAIIIPCPTDRLVTIT